MTKSHTLMTKSQLVYNTASRANHFSNDDIIILKSNQIDY